MLKKKLFTLSLFIFFVFSSCSNIVGSGESCGGGMTFALGDSAARNVVDAVSANEVVNADSQLQVVCELLRGDFVISTDTKTVPLKDLKNTVFNLKNVLYGNDYFVSLKIYFEDILIYNALSDRIELNSSNEQADIKLSLQEEKSKISYELNQGEFVPGTVKPMEYFINSDVELPEPERPLFNFGGWFLNSECTGERITKLGKNKFIGDVTLYALWIGKNQISPVVITPSDTTKVDFGYEITLSCPTSDVSIYYTTDGSEPDKTSHLYNDTKKITVDDNIIAGGDTFVVKAIALKDKMENSRVSEKSYTMNRYNVTFNENNHGTAPGQATNLKKGDTLKEPEKLSHTGYIFGDWYKEPSCTNKWNFNTDTISESVTLYAKWTPVTYKVIFHKNDGTPADTEERAEQNFTYDKSESLKINSFTKTGYTLKEWNTSSDGSGTGYTDTASVLNLATSGNFDLYAQWTPITYKVVFHKNDGTPAVTEEKAEQTFTYDRSESLTTNSFTKSGFEFNGWATAKDGTKVYDDKAVVSNLSSTTDGVVDLYALWNDVAPAEVTNFDVITGDQKLILKWTAPADEDLAKVVISSIKLPSPLEITKGNSETTISNLTNGSEYEYTFEIKSVDNGGNESSAITKTIIAIPNSITPPSSTTTSSIKYGYWPQSQSSVSMIDNKIRKVYNWDAYKGTDGAYYVKINSNYYKLEQIQWSKLSSSNVYLSNLLLFAMASDDAITYLNDTFKLRAFGPEADNYLKATPAENGSHKVSLPSHSQVTNTSDGFSDQYDTNDSKRMKGRTKYAEATGIYLGDGGSGYRSWWWLYDDGANPNWVATPGDCHSRKWDTYNNSGGIAPVIKLE